MNSYIRFRMSCLLVLQPLILLPLSLFLLYLFFVFRSSFQFLGRSATPSPAVPVIISSGRVATIGAGDTVLLVEDVKYRAKNCSRRMALWSVRRSTHETDHSNGSSASCGSHHPRPMILSQTLICHLLLACVPTQSLLVFCQTPATQQLRWIFHPQPLILINGAP